ncbi:hypothetical protein WA158_001176 [Blastocystis sp. Blastoise]
MCDILSVFPTLKKTLDDVPKVEQQFRYGTAGFRAEGAVLDNVFARCGVVAALRSMCTKKTIGVMVTASHNPENENGIKIVEPDGGMLAIAWEGFATSMANVSVEDCIKEINEFVDKENIDIHTPCKIILGRDTRSSSLRLSNRVVDVCKSMSCEVDNLEEVTTPLLHHVVRMHNFKKTEWEGRQGYFKMLGDAYKTLCQGFEDKCKQRTPLYIDCSNGAGALVIDEIQAALGDYLKIIPINNHRTNLNYLCGANHLVTKTCLPTECTMEQAAERRSCAFDGDADRIVYFTSRNGKFVLLDGDKLLSIFAIWCRDQLKNLNLPNTLGVVKTAYANGASTDFVKEHNMPLVLAKTGVKNLHPKAHQFDIGMYFEANGHGTVLFKDTFLNELKSLDNSTLTEVQIHAKNNIIAASELVNQAVGDALSDSLFVEAILSTTNITLDDWINMYTDLPSVNSVVKVEDRSIFKNNDDETRCLEPAGIQEAIDELVKQVPHGRSFVRPSGTENVVRVYAEADTKEHALWLAKEVERTTYKLARGVGEMP